MFIKCLYIFSQVISKRYQSCNINRLQLYASKAYMDYPLNQSHLQDLIFCHRKNVGCSINLLNEYNPIG